MSPGHKIGYQMLGRQIFCAEMMRSTAGFSLSFSHYEYTDMFQGNNEAKICLPTSTVKVSVKACSLHINHYPCYWLKIHLL